MNGWTGRAAGSGRARVLVTCALTAALWGGCASLGGPGTAGEKAGGPGAPGWVTQVTITRDEFGVPYIDAATQAGAFAALAYAMAEDGYRELEEEYARALGTAAAYHGESRVPADELRMKLRTVETARRQYAAEPAEAVRAYQAFADGLNYFMRMHPEMPPRHIARYDGWMVLAFANELSAVRPIENALLNRTLQGRRRATTIPDDAFAWVVRTADGRPLLLSAFSAEHPYEMNLHTADGWRFHGYGSLGSAIPGNGYSAQIAFSTIAGDATGAVRRVTAESRITQRSDTLRINTSQGVIVRRTATSLTEAGPVIAAVGDTAFAVSMADIPNRSNWTRWNAMAHASDAGSFATAFGTAADRRTWPGEKALMVDAGGSAVVFEGGAVRTGRAESVAIGVRSNIAISNGAGAGGGVGSAMPGWTLRTLARTAFDTRVHSADAEIAALVDEWEQVGARNPERALAMDSAVTMLRAWDRVSTLQSPVMSLYAAFFDEPGRETFAFSRFTALERVVLDRRRFPPQPWGSVNALRRSGQGSVPVAGAPARLGIMFAYDAASRMESFVWAVECGTGAASSVRSFGQGADPASTHWFDQAILFAAGSLKAAPVSGAVMGAGMGAVPYHPGETGRRTP